MRLGKSCAGFSATNAESEKADDFKCHRLFIILPGRFGFIKKSGPFYKSWLFQTELLNPFDEIRFTCHQRIVDGYPVFCGVAARFLHDPGAIEPAEFLIDGPVSFWSPEQDAAVTRKCKGVFSWYYFSSRAFRLFSPVLKSFQWHCSCS